MRRKLIESLALIAIISFSYNIFASGNKFGSGNKADKYDYNYNYNYSELNNYCQVYDPYESLNRKIFVFNGILDTFLLRPVAKGYGRFTNDYTKGRVGSFIGNIQEPLTTVNYAIQGKAENGFKSFWRFAINSTIGILGLFDVADKVGLKAQAQTFGNTLGHYGVGSGPYIVLPIYGGMAMRDVTDSTITNNFLNPGKWFMHRDFKLAVTGADMVHSRNQIMPLTDHLTKNSPDVYIAMRNAILQNRESKIDYPQGFKCPKVGN